MRRITKIIPFVLCISITLTAAVMLSSCGKKYKVERIKIVCSAYPQYDWTNIIIGEKADLFEIKYLLESGVDLHNYNPSFDDCMSVLNADLVVYSGAISDPWVLALEKQYKIKLNRISLVGAVDTLLQSPDEDHEYDEHIWLSLKNAVICADKICDKIAELDPDNAEYYRTNADNYINELNGLDEAYTAVAAAPDARDTVVIADRFPFRYLFKDYGINCYAAFDSCSAATDVPISKIAFLVEKVNEYDIRVILKIEGSNSKCAETICNDSNPGNQQILTMHSIQSVSRDNINSGFNYLDEMKKNLNVLTQALA